MIIESICEMACKVAAYRPRMEPNETIAVPAYRPRMEPAVPKMETQDETRSIATYSKKRNIKSRPCEKFITKGFCPYGYKCLYSHNLSIDNPKFKSVHCTNFSKGYCSYGMKCSFLHCSSTIHPFDFLFATFATNVQMDKCQVPCKRLQVFVNICQ